MSAPLLTPALHTHVSPRFSLLIFAVVSQHEDQILRVKRGWMCLASPACEAGRPCRGHNLPGAPHSIICLPACQLQ